MINQIQVDKIIEYLNTVTDITDVVSNRIYRWEPSSEDQPWTYITVNQISETSTLRNKGTRLEFRFIAHDEDTKYRQLYDLQAIMTNTLVVDCNTIDFNWFVCYWVEELSTNIQGIDDKWRKNVLKDYRFYFLR